MSARERALGRRDAPTALDAPAGRTQPLLIAAATRLFVPLVRNARAPDLSLLV
ncbi:hypothetical protein ACFQS1_25040 [Paractinoplanes rhizophilus]|uniref:Uncharacterized protein n=1 Tax=Paractinoplanes rhizophilus TaxID=1416877 RepID=A0ABW2HZU3_9ACTN